MKKYCCGALLLLICAVTAAENQLPELVFQLGGRDFSRAEALLLSGGESDPLRARALIQQNFPAAATIVICSRSGIELSPEKTADSLQSALLLMAPEARENFLRELKNNNMTPELWLKRESAKLENQLNEAVRRWYMKNYAQQVKIDQRHIQDYYYRNMRIFRRLEVKSEQIIVFNAANSGKLQQALSAMQQGEAIESVRRRCGLPIDLADLLNDLQQSLNTRTRIAPGYEVIKSSKYIYLLCGNALRQFYLPLDDKLQSAIGNALYDALAKATLAEVLKKEFPAGGVRFY